MLGYNEKVYKDFKYIRVKYDSNNQTWLVSASGHSPLYHVFFEITEGAPGIIVQNDGKVLAVWPLPIERPDGWQ